MTTAQYLDAWRSADLITADQHAALSALARKERFSVHLELNALLYGGVLAFAAGLEWTVREHFANLGDAAIVVSLSALVAGSLYFCFTRAAPFSTTQVAPPSFAFDARPVDACRLVRDPLLARRVFQRDDAQRGAHL